MKTNLCKAHARPLDILIFAVALLAVIGASLLVLGRHSGARYVQISGEEGEWIAPFDEDAEYRISGPIGITHVHIHNGQAAIVESPCANQLCVLSGAISEPDQWVACLPNKVFVHITSSGTTDQGAIDAGTF